MRAFLIAAVLLLSSPPILGATQQGHTPQKEAALWFELVHGSTGVALPPAIVETSIIVGLNQSWSYALDAESGFLRVVPGEEVGSTSISLGRIVTPGFGAAALKLSKEMARSDSALPIRVALFPDASLQVEIPDEYCGVGYSLTAKKWGAYAFPAGEGIVDVYGSVAFDPILLSAGQNTYELRSLPSNTQIDLVIRSSASPKAPAISQVSIVLQPRESRTLSLPNPKPVALSGVVSGRDGTPAAHVDIWITAATHAGARTRKSKNARLMTLDTVSSSLLKVVTTDENGEYSIEMAPRKLWVCVAPVLPYGMSVPHFVDLEASDDIRLDLLTNQRQLEFEFTGPGVEYGDKVVLDITHENSFWSASVRNGIRATEGASLSVPWQFPNLEIRASTANGSSEWIKVAAHEGDHRPIRIELHKKWSRFDAVPLEVGEERSEVSYSIGVCPEDRTLMRVVNSYDPVQSRLMVKRSSLPGWVYLFNSRYETISAGWGDADDKRVVLKPLETTQVVILDPIPERRSRVEVLLDSKRVACYEFDTVRFVAAYLPVGEIEFRIWTSEHSKPTRLRERIESGSWKVIELPR